LALLVVLDQEFSGRHCCRRSSKCCSSLWVKIFIFRRTPVKLPSEYRSIADSRRRTVEEVPPPPPALCAQHRGIRGRRRNAPLGPLRGFTLRNSRFLAHFRSGCNPLYPSAHWRLRADSHRFPTFNAL